MSTSALTEIYLSSPESTHAISVCLARRGASTLLSLAPLPSPSYISPNLVSSSAMRRRPLCTLPPSYPTSQGRTGTLKWGFVSSLSTCELYVTVLKAEGLPAADSNGMCSSAAIIFFKNPTPLNSPFSPSPPPPSFPSFVSLHSSLYFFILFVVCYRKKRSLRGDGIWR